MRKIHSLMLTAGLAFTFAGAQTAWAVLPPTASAAITVSQAGSTYTYSLNVSDALTSPSPIGTYWFAWVPGKNFLTTSPLSVTNPSGWTDSITHGGSTDGYAIQWLASSSATAIAPGNSLAFSFSTIDPPSSVFGNSSFYATTPTTTSVAYDAGIFSDAGTTFTASGVPEPVSMALLTPVAFLLGRRRRLTAM